MALRVQASVNLAAVDRNVARIAAAAPGVQICAVVKADAYGHGMAPVARAARRAGAGWLAVATAGEAAALRAASIDGPVLVLGVLSDDELRTALEAGADVVAWREDQVARVAELGGGRIHVKFDSGMGRLGTRDPEQATRVAQAADADPATTLAGLMTHFATADEPGDAFFGEQLGRFTDWVAPLRSRFPQALVHAANSAATLRDPAAHFDLIRPGVALYGLDPFGADPADHGLEPALSLHSYVGEVKDCGPGESAGYGRRFVAAAATRIATVPVGYGDGWRRDLTNNAELLAGGRRLPLVGTVSMDNVTLDAGDGSSLRRGEPVVLIGEQDGERILVEELARRLGTINYEITCGLSGRVPREHHRDGTPDAGR